MCSNKSGGGLLTCKFLAWEWHHAKGIGVCRPRPRCVGHVCLIAVPLVCHYTTACNTIFHSLGREVSPGLPQQPLHLLPRWLPLALGCNPQWNTDHGTVTIAAGHQTVRTYKQSLVIRSSCPRQSGNHQLPLWQQTTSEFTGCWVETFAMRQWLRSSLCSPRLNSQIILSLGDSASVHCLAWPIILSSCDPMSVYPLTSPSDNSLIYVILSISSPL